MNIPRLQTAAPAELLPANLNVGKGMRLLALLDGRRSNYVPCMWFMGIDATRYSYGKSLAWE